MKRFNFLLLPVMLVYVFSVQNLFASQEYKSFFHSNNADGNMSVMGNEYNLNLQDKGYRDFNEDTTAGVYYLHARYYDSATRQFLIKDPAKMKNLYAYCAKDPVNYIDPDGNIGLAWIEGLVKRIFCCTESEAVRGGLNLI